MDLAGPRFPRLREAVERLLDRPATDAELQRVMAQPALRGRFLESLTGRLTVGESFFFRNEHHFRVLREQVLPQILRENAAKREIRVWSAGCSTGEEPYSIAILLDQLVGGDRSWRTAILGTDLNPEFLSRAREGRYRLWSFRQTNIHQNRSYFTPEGEEYRVAPRIRDRVRFNYLNLVKDVYPSPLTGTTGLDLILFRNVAIYLKPEVTAAIVARFRQALRPGGWLLLGETEVGVAATAGFDARHFEQATFYQTSSAPRERGAEFRPLPLPPLAAASPAPAAEVAVPPLPVWAPLPGNERRNGAGRSQEAAQAGPGGEALTTVGAGRGAAPSPEADEEREPVDRLLRRGDVAEALRAIERLPSPAARAEMRLRVIRELLSTADVLPAREQLDVCLAEYPLLLEAHLLKAGFAEEAGDLSAAERSYRQALYLDRTSAIAHLHLALVQQQQGRASEAERSLRTILKLTAGKDPQALVEHGDGMCYGRLTELARLLRENQE